MWLKTCRCDVHVIQVSSYAHHVTRIHEENAQNTSQIHRDVSNARSLATDIVIAAALLSALGVVNPATISTTTLQKQNATHFQLTRNICSNFC